MITTHVLDTSIGRPAGGVEVRLDHQVGDGAWHTIGTGRTDPDGRLRSLMPENMSPLSGTCRLTFDTAAYFRGCSVDSFYPRVVVEFVVREDAHYHVPLLISPYGYSTYRGT